MLQLAELPLLAHAAWTRRQSRRVRGERELLAAIGNPLLAARPSRPEALRALCAQLLEHWFAAGRPLLPLVSLRPGDGRTTLATELSPRSPRARSSSCDRARTARASRGCADVLRAAQQ